MMESDAAINCRSVLNRLRSQVDAYLPMLTYNYNGQSPESVVPLDRLPMIGTIVQQLIECEATFAAANPQQPFATPDIAPET